VSARWSAADRPRVDQALVAEGRALEVIEERAADQLALRETDDQLARRGAAAARLDRPRAPLQGQLTVDQPQKETTPRRRRLLNAYPRQGKRPCPARCMWWR